jgi:ribonuclease Z
MSELRRVFLGTGSGRPTLRRNVSALHVQYEGEGLLFDCGEGTQVQMQRSPVRPRKMSGIFITHFHGDHINGLPGLLGTMALEGHEDPLLVVAPRGIDRYFATLRELRVMGGEAMFRTREAARGEVFRGTGYRVSACMLRHRIPAFGYRFDEDDRLGRFDVEKAKAAGVPAGPLFGQLQRGQDVTLPDGRLVLSTDVVGPTRKGRSFAYICDTRPSDEVADFVKGVDILIHEATYLHELREDAARRGHSTVLEAATIAARAEVGQLFLTHISPKHGSNRELIQEARTVFPSLDVAEDFREITMPVPE